MNVLMINGSPHPEGNTFVALDCIAQELKRNEIDSEIVHIGRQGIKGCNACMVCAETGYCAYNGDGVNACIDKLKEADGLIVGSPVYFAGPNASLCGFLDRLFYQKSDPYAFKPAAAITVSRRGGNSASFDRLNKYFTFAQMPIVSANYWNELHGAREGEAAGDAEGLQTMRTLARNMAWLLKSLAYAKDAVRKPTLEPRQKFSFIRD